MAQNDKIEERLSRMEAQQERVIAITEGIAERLKRFDAEHDKVRGMLHGDGSNGGIVVRLDRLEQAQERSRWLTRAILGALVSILVAGSWAFLTTRP